jgi:hypothetical protein
MYNTLKMDSSTVICMLQQQLNSAQMSCYDANATAHATTILYPVEYQINMQRVDSQEKAQQANAPAHLNHVQSMNRISNMSIAG